MKSFICCFFFFSLSFFFSHARISAVANTSSKLDKACNEINDPFNSGVTANSCHLVFQHDPHSRTAVDYHSLGLIAVNVTASAAMNVIKGMKQTLVKFHPSLNNQQNSAILKCIRMYEQSIPVFQLATDYIKSKNYELAENILRTARDLNSDCDNAMNADKEKKAANYVRQFRTFYSTAVPVVIEMIYALAWRNLIDNA